MRPKFCLIVVMVAAAVLLLQGPVPAAITKCTFNVFTTNFSPGGAPFQLNFFVELEDSVLRPPEALTLFEIHVPDGTVYDYSADYWKYYSEFGNNFFFSVPGPIQLGTYKLKVKDKSNPRITIVNTDKLTDLEPLAVPNMVYPTATSPVTVVPLNATFSWDPVDGAQCYRVEIFDESAKSPVFNRDRHPLWVYTNFYTVPIGVLVPNRNYSIQVEARDSDKNIMRRSRTFFVPFKAEP
jgi:hypothetical protein